MYEIKNVKIWKTSSNVNIFKCRDKVLEVEASKRKEISMSEKCQKVFNEIFALVPTADFSEIKKRRYLQVL